MRLSGDGGEAHEDERWAYRNVRRGSPQISDLLRHWLVSDRRMCIVKVIGREEAVVSGAYVGGSKRVEHPNGMGRGVEETVERRAAKGRGRKRRHGRNALNGV